MMTNQDYFKINLTLLLFAYGFISYNLPLFTYLLLFIDLLFSMYYTYKTKLEFDIPTIILSIIVHFSLLIFSIGFTIPSLLIAGIVSSFTSYIFVDHTYAKYTGILLVVFLILTAYLRDLSAMVIVTSLFLPSCKSLLLQSIFSTKHTFKLTQ